MELKKYMTQIHEIETSYRQCNLSFDDMIESLEGVRIFAYNDHAQLDASDYDIICTLIRFAKYTS
jgi:hypothetical protein